MHITVLKPYSNFSLNPKIFVIFFELGIHNSCRSIWDKTTNTRYRFHLAQACFRDIEKCRLVQEYKHTNGEIERGLLYGFGLPFKHPNQFKDCIAIDLDSYKPKNAVVDNFLNYLLEQYIDEDFRFTPNLWAEFANKNAFEAFHSKF